jgi:hypothetical protein
VIERTTKAWFIDRMVLPDEDRKTCRPEDREWED